MHHFLRPVSTLAVRAPMDARLHERTAAQPKARPQAPRFEERRGEKL